MFFVGDLFMTQPISRSAFSAFSVVQPVEYSSDEIFSMKHAYNEIVDLRKSMKVAAVLSVKQFERVKSVFDFLKKPKS